MLRAFFHSAPTKMPYDVPRTGCKGIRERDGPRRRTLEQPMKEESKLAADPIKVVRGPDGQLFVTDHHHGARAWLLAGYASGICSIAPDPSSADPEKFWPRLEELKKVHLATEPVRS